MIQVSLLSCGGLLVFSPHDVTELITLHLSQVSVKESNSSTLLFSLATSLTKFFSNKKRRKIVSEVTLLMNYLTDSVLPAIVFPEMPIFAPEILQQQSLIRPFLDIIISNPELLFDYFGFLAQTMRRYSETWTQYNVQRWMLCILISLGTPESGMAFQGAINFLVIPYFVLSYLTSDEPCDKSPGTTT